MPAANGPSGPLPAYSGRAVELFDDSIDPAAVGIAADQSDSTSDDALLRERTQTGDAVVRARVVTITSSAKNDRPTWQLGLRPVETLAGKRAPEGDFMVQVGSRSPAAGVVRSLEGRLVGTTFVVFMREFAGAVPGGDGPQNSAVGAGDGVPSPERHFHFEKDDKAALDAVHQASLLGEVR